jgi:hypothetical protein
MQTWDLWYPKAASTGLPFARGRLDFTDVLLVHAPPEYLTVEVLDDANQRVAFSADLPRTQQTPMARLTRHGDAISREDVWPSDNDIGRPVLLPGGEVAILKSWWHADDRKEWRWQIELYNSIR